GELGGHAVNRLLDHVHQQRIAYIVLVPARLAVAGGDVEPGAAQRLDLVRGVVAVPVLAADGAVDLVDGDAARQRAALDGDHRGDAGLARIVEVERAAEGGGGREPAGEARGVPECSAAAHRHARDGLPVAGAV